MKLYVYSFVSGYTSEAENFYFTKEEKAREMLDALITLMLDHFNCTDQSCASTFDELMQEQEKASKDDKIELYVSTKDGVPYDITFDGPEVYERGYITVIDTDELKD